MVTILGLGYVGLTTALGLAEMNSKVYGFDSDSNHVARLCNSAVTFKEPYLHDKLRAYHGTRLIFNMDMRSAIRDSEYIFVCVGTPSEANGSVDLADVKSAVIDILSYLPHDNKYRLLIIKSTVPPNTCKNVIEPLIRDNGYGESAVGIVSNPEFLRVGFCWEDFITPSKIVIGTNNSTADEMMTKLYELFHAPIHSMSLSSAEFSKYLSNIFLASLISFSNEMAFAASIFNDVDVKAAFLALHADGRLKDSSISSYVYPGCGFGGYCLPKDIKAFHAALRTQNYDSSLIGSIIEINDQLADLYCKKIESISTSESAIGILGLAFKPDSDDVRETPASRIIDALQLAGYKNIYAYDPVANETYERAYKHQKIHYSKSAEELISAADIIMITTAWPEFKGLDFKGKHVIDGRYFIE